MSGKNPYFDPWNEQTEQDMYDGLIQESIQIYGETMYYLPRRPANFDGLYTEDDQDFFDTAYLSVFYLKNVEGWEGQGNFLEKFGLEIRDQITLSVSNTLFMQDVGMAENFVRPREGDLIYFPLNDKVFEIAFVDKFSLFYPMGFAPVYDITCQLYEYSGQRFTTGISDIDKIQAQLSENLYDWAVLAEDGKAFLMETGDTWVLESYQEVLSDPMDQTVTIETDVNGLLDFTETDPFTDDTFN